MAAVGLAPRNLVAWAAGLALGLAPLSVHFLVATPGAFIQNLVLDVLHSDAGRRLPVDWTSKFFWLVLSSCLLPAAIAAAKASALPRSRADRFLMAVAAICLCILPQATSRTDNWHLAYIGFVTMPLSLLSILSLWRAWAGRLPQDPGPPGRPARIAARFASAGASALALLAAFIGLFSLQAGFEGLSAHRGPGGWACPGCVVNEGRSVPVGRDATALQAVVDELERLSRPSDTLFVGTRDMARTAYSDSYIFFLFPKLRPGQFYIEMAPGISNGEGTRTIRDLAGVKFLVLSTAYDGWDEPNASAARGSEEPGRIVARDFCPVMERAPFTLLERCAR